MLALERTVEALQRELEYLRPLLPQPPTVRRTRTALTFDDGNYPVEPAGTLRVVRGIAEAGSTQDTIFLQTADTPFGREASALDGEYDGRLLRLVGGTGKGQSFKILSYVGATRAATISGNFAPFPDSTTQYSIEFAYPVIFLGGDEDRRQVAARVLAVQLGSTFLPPNTLVQAVEINGRWFIEHSSGEGTICVPTDTIPAATRSGGAFTPGVGQGYVYEWDDETGEIVPAQDVNGALVQKRLLNLNEKSLTGATVTSGDLLGTLDGDTLVTLDGQGIATLVEIGTDTDVLFAKLGRSGELIIGGDGDAGSWSLRDNQPTPNTIAIDSDEVLQFISSIDETQTDDWLLWEATEADPDTMSAIFGRLLVVSDFDSSVDLFPTEEVKFTTVNPSQNVAVSKAADIVTVQIDLAGVSSWNLRDNQPTPNTIAIDAGETLQFLASIDETQLNDWLLWEVTEAPVDTMEAVFGRMLVVSDFDSSVNLFPTEEVKFTTVNPSGQVSVTKAVDTVTVEFDLDIASSWTLRDDTGPTDVTIDAGETLQFTIAIDETQTAVWAEWNAAEGLPDTMELSFGRVLIVSDFDSSVNLFPTEELKFTTINPSGDVAVTKAGDVVTVEVDLGGTGSWTLRDDTGPTDVVIDSGETLQLTTTIDETQNAAWAEWNAAAGIPNTMELSFGRMMVVSDFDSSVNVYPTETLKFTTVNPSGNVSVTKAVDTTTVEIDLASAGAGFHTIKDGDADTQTLNDSEVLHLRGDRDVSAVLGNFIETEVTKPAGEVIVDINAVGDMFRFQDNRASPGFVVVAAGETITCSYQIDETMTDKFAEWRHTGNDFKLVQGKMLDVIDGSSGSVDIFPLETLEFITSNPAGQVAVTKSLDKVTVDIDLAGSGGGSHTIQDGDLDSVTLNSGETFRIQGDRDVTVAVGNFIETEVVDLGTTIEMTINAVGDMFTFETETSNVIVGVNEIISMTCAIDEVGLPNTFCEVRGSGNNLTWAYGKVAGIKDDQPSPNTETLFPTETIHFQTVKPAGNVSVSKISNEIDVEIDVDALPIGAMIMGTKAPVDPGTGKFYLDRGGVADTDWALMDGSSNVTPGSGIDMQGYFARGSSGGGSPSNAAFGRTGSATTNSDEVTIDVADHVEHYHEHQPDTCHCDVAGSSTHFDFSALTGKLTSGARDINNNPLTLAHSMNLTNNQASGDNVELLPAHKQIHFFERVAE